MAEASDLALVADVEPRYLGRDSVHRFLGENHCKMAREFETYGCLWSERAAAMARLGLRNPKGDPPTARNLRDTWVRVCRDVANAASPDVVGVFKSAPALVAAPMPVDDDEFGPASLRRFP